MEGQYKFADYPRLLDQVKAAAKPPAKGKERAKPPYMGVEDPSFLMKLIAAAYGMENYPPFATAYQEAYPPGYTPPGVAPGPSPTPMPTPTMPPRGPLPDGINAVNTNRQEEIDEQIGYCYLPGLQS